MKQLIEKFKPFSYLLLAALVVEILERIIDIALGDGDGTITHPKLYFLIGSFQVFAVVISLLWFIISGIATTMGKSIQVKHFIYSLIPVFFTLFLIEGAARFLYQGAQKKSAVSNELKEIYTPANINRAKEQKQRMGQNNAYGFRGPDLDFNKKPDDFVIVVLGGSVATGAWTDQYENMPAVYLENHLKDHIREKYNKNLKVYSLAESGSDAEDEAFWLFKLGIHLQPDAVVSITGFNNIFNSIHPYWDFSSGGRAFTRPGINIDHAADVQNASLEDVPRITTRAIFKTLHRHSAAIRAMDEFITNVRSQRVKAPVADTSSLERTDIKNHIKALSEVPKPASINMEASKRLRLCLDNINTFCKSKNIRYYVVLQPFSTCGTTAMNALPGDGSKDNREQFVYRGLLQAWEQAGTPDFPFINATPMLSDKLDSMNLFGDNCHMWDKGFVYMNDEIVKFLKTNL